MLRMNIVVVLILVGLNLIACEDLDDVEATALTRDGLARKNPDELLGGFFPAWAAVLYVLAISGLVLGVFSFLGYAFGVCKKPDPEFDTFIA